METDIIRENTLRELAATRSMHSASAIGRQGGYVVSVRCGAVTRLLGSTRGSVRIFSNLTGLAVFLRGLGIAHFDVSSEHYERGRVRPPRPDRAEALKRTRTTPRQSDFLAELP